MLNALSKTREPNMMDLRELDVVELTHVEGGFLPLVCLAAFVAIEVGYHAGMVLQE